MASTRLEPSEVRAAVDRIAIAIDGLIPRGPLDVPGLHVSSDAFFGRLAVLKWKVSSVVHRSAAWALAVECHQESLGSLAAQRRVDTPDAPATERRVVIAADASLLSEFEAFLGSVVSVLDTLAMVLASFGAVKPADERRLYFSNVHKCLPSSDKWRDIRTALESACSSWAREAIERRNASAHVTAVLIQMQVALEDAPSHVKDHSVGGPRLPRDPLRTATARMFGVPVMCGSVSEEVAVPGSGYTVYLVADSEHRVVLELERPGPGVLETRDASEYVDVTLTSLLTFVALVLDHMAPLVPSRADWKITAFADRVVQISSVKQ